MLDPYRMVAVNVVLSLFLILGILFYGYIFPKRKPNLFILLLIISLLPLVSILRKGTYESGDLTIHTSFLINFYKNLQEGIIVPQWAGNLCAGYGCPVFLFEYTLPYYIGSVFHLIGFSFLNSMKLMLAFSFLLSSIGMYLWAKEQFGKIPAFAAALFYQFAPYHLIDMHFRVSVGEVLSFSFIPFLFLFSKKLIETRKLKFFIFQGIIIIFLLLSHSSTSLIVLPMAVIYGLVLIAKGRQRKKQAAVIFITSFVFGLLLSAFYWIPTLYEVKFAWIGQVLETTDFKSLGEYLYSPAFYGFLFQGQHGEIRLIVGYPHLLAVFTSIVLLYKNKIDLKNKNILKLFLIFFLILFIMMLSISKPIWQNFPLLKTFVMPWRLLVPIAFLTSGIAAIVVSQIKNKIFITLICIIVIFSTILNWGNRKMIPEDYENYKNQWSLYTEYLDPKDPLFLASYKNRVGQVPEIVLNRPKSPIEILKGNADFAKIEKKSTKHSYIVYAKTDAYIKESTFYFPGWSLKVNNLDYPINFKNPKYASIITFKLPKGLYKADLIFEDTPVRKISKLISLGTLFIVALSLLIITFSPKALSRGW